MKCSVTAHAPCHVTYHRWGGGLAKMIHIFEIHDANLPTHFVFRALRRRLSHNISENSIYSIVKFKVH